jgi:hypothetical protein
MNVDEMVGCVARGGEEKCIGVIGGNPQRDHLENLGIDERIILKGACKKNCKRQS